MARTTKKAASGRRNQLRIIAGSWRGRRLQFPDAEGLRPTGDRIRETLFNWIAADIAGRRCLDAFAGSGALGFEALSRGAAEAVMIENNAAAFRQLQASKALLGADGAILVQGSAPHWLDNATCQPFDLVFLDPPFASDLLQQAVNGIDSRNLLAHGGLVYIETATGVQPELPGSWRLLREKHSGDVHYRLLRHD